VNISQEVCFDCGHHLHAADLPVARPLDPPAPTVPQLLHRTVVARLTAERDAVREELEAVEAQMEPLARSMIYKGNSVDYWWAKAHAYKGIVHAVCEAFRALGYGGEMGDLETLPKRLGTFAESLLGQRRDLEVALDRWKREVEALREGFERERKRSNERWQLIHAAAKHVEFDKLDEKLLPGAVEKLLMERDAARREAGALRERIDAAYRALEAANEMVPRGPAGDTLAEKITALVAILRTAYAQKAVARTEGIASGRAAAIVEAVDMVENNFAHGDRMSEDTATTARWIVEQLKRIKP
jgi:hypothetical protein